MKIGKRIIAIALAAVLTCPFLPVVSHAAQEVCEGNVLGSFNGSTACMNGEDLHICAYNFPDENFRGCITRWYVSNDGLLTEAEVAEWRDIRCSFKGIADLRGIEFFTAVERLFCCDNSLTKLDLSKNTQLVILECSGNQIASLDVSRCMALAYLNYDGNPLAELKLPDTMPPVEGTVLSSGICGDGVYWKLDDAGTLTIYGTGRMDDYGDTGEGVYESPPYDKTSVKRINVEQGVTHIGSCAFAVFNELLCVSMADTVESIGESAFSGCSSLVNVYMSAAITSIGSNAFSDCFYITDIKIPSGVTEIWEYAFFRCLNLGLVEIPCSVQSIADTAFCGAGVTEFAVDPYNPAYSSIDGVLYNKAGTTLLAYPGRGNSVYAVPNGVTTIGSCAFAKSTAIDKLILPKSVTSIGSWAFDESASANAPLDIYIENPGVGFEYRVHTLGFQDCITFYGAEGSTAEQYAQDHGIEFVLMQTYTAQNVPTADTEAGGLIFHIDAPYSKFTDVAVDGVPLESADFTISEGSTIITLSEEYLLALPAGQHTLTAFFQDGYATSIFTTNAACGDIDGDGEISDWDAIVLNRYLAGWTVEIDLKAVDVDGDGEVSDWDAIILERYLAGWDVKLES